MDDINFFEAWGKKSQDFFQSAFQIWGGFVARNPGWIILISALVVVILSLGVPKIILTTDPIQLWSTEGSKVRQEKDFFDENFGAFYRTEQVILKLQPELEKNTQSYTSFNGVPFNFSAILDQERLLEVLEFQNTIRYLKAPFPEGMDRLGRDYVTLKVSINM